MDMHSRDQYLKELQKEYVRADKKEKRRLLDEAEKRTNLVRKYLIRKLNVCNRWQKKGRKRKEIYDGEVRAALAKVWEIFDHPCGQRLTPLLKGEVDRLRRLGELPCSDEVAEKLKRIGSTTIDQKLKHHKEGLYRSRRRSKPKFSSLLYQKIPTRLNDWDTSVVGNLAVDIVEHCGFSKRGEYINSLAVTDISAGWWEAQAMMGRGQYPAFEALKKIRSRAPFRWREIHPDNDPTVLNFHIFSYCQIEEIRFSRSRPNKKNDNCYIEQKNWTHIKKKFGYLRYDTPEELQVINDLCENELRLYMNFFQPVMKLKEKIRVGGKIHRKYDFPKTPYQRLMESGQIAEEKKEELRTCYLSLNPAQLGRAIQAKLDKLYQIYREKMKNANS